MEKEKLKKIFEFIEEKEGHKFPIIWKLINNIPFTKEELNIEGDLDLSYTTKITSLPQGLRIEGDFYIDYSYVELPKGLEVGGDVYVTGTYLEDYTKEQVMTMIYPGFIKGDLIYNMGDSYENDGDEDENDDGFL
jgi:hypothetical protein